MRWLSPFHPLSPLLSLPPVITHTLVKCDEETKISSEKIRNKNWKKIMNKSNRIVVKYDLYSCDYYYCACVLVWVCRVLSKFSIPFVSIVLLLSTLLLLLFVFHRDCILADDLPKEIKNWPNNKVNDQFKRRRRRRWTGRKGKNFGTIFVFYFFFFLNGRLGNKKKKLENRGIQSEKQSSRIAESIFESMCEWMWAIFSVCSAHMRVIK